MPVRSIRAARAVLGGLCLVAIAAFLLLHLHPEHGPGLSHAVLALAVFPSLLALATLAWSRTAGEKVVPSIGWVTVGWYMLSIPAFIVAIWDGHVRWSGHAMLVQMLALPLLVSTRDPVLIGLLRRIVRVGLAALALFWLTMSASFAWLVRAQAASVADGAPYCLSTPSPGWIGSSSTVPSSGDILLLQRVMAYPYRRDLTRYRLQLTVLRDGRPEFHHWSFMAMGFAPGGDHGLAPGCEGAMRGGS